MAGHSKFKNIMYRKGAQDKHRARQFARIARDIMVAVKIGGDDGQANPRLRAAMAAARAANMPKDNIARSIRRAQESGEGADWEEVRYEGYGPFGVAVLVEALTDNRNRTAGEIRVLFGKAGGALAATDAVVFQFERLGELRFARASADGDKMFELALEAGAADCGIEDEAHVITTEPDQFAAVREHLEAALGQSAEGELIWRARTPVQVSDPERAEALFRLLEALDDNEDVRRVYANCRFDEGVGGAGDAEDSAGA